MPTGSAPRCHINFQEFDFARNPYPIYAVLREQYPICQTNDNTYLLSRYTDVKMALQQYEVFASGWAAAPIAHPKWLREDCKRGDFIAETDPPVHTQHSATISKALVGRAIDAIIPELKIIAQTYVDKIRHRSTIDFFQDFAYPLVSAMLDKATGLNTGDSAHLIRNWIAASESFTAECPEPNKRTQIEALILAQNAAYDDLVNKKRLKPLNDVASLLANASVAGEYLPNKVLHTALNAIAIGGLESPSQILANTIITCVRNPDLLQLLRAQPEYIPAFIEEIIRRDNPAQASMRITTEEIKLHNVTLPPRALVLAIIGSANRDPTQFTEPDAFILSRPNIKTHLGFGYGVHACIGATLARAEIRVALEALLNTFEGFDCPPDEHLEWCGTSVGRVLRSLPVRLQPSH